MSDSPRFTTFGKLISILLVAGLIAMGVWLLLPEFGQPSTTDQQAPQEAADAEEPAVSEVQMQVPMLSPAAPFNYRDNIVPIEISEKSLRTSTPPGLHAGTGTSRRVISPVL